MRHLLHVFPSFAMGGSQVRLVRLINYFSDQYNHSIVSLSGDVSAFDLIEDKMRVRCFAADSSFVRSNISSLKKYRAMIRMQSPDLLLTYNWGSVDWAIASLWLKINHVAVEDGFGPEEAEVRFRRRSMVRRFVFGLNHSRVVVPSKTLASIARNEWRISSGSVLYIPNGVDPFKYKVTFERKRPSIFSVNANEIVVGTLAGLRPEKRIDLLIEAVAAVREKYAVRLVIAGSGPLGSALRELCRSKGYDGWVNFIGFADKPESVLFEFDVFALSSMTEQLPISMIEAMMSGLPVVSTDVGDVRASLPIEQGQWVTRDSLSELVSALLGAVSDRAARVRMGALNREFALERFSSKPMFDAWGTIFDT